MQLLVIPTDEESIIAQEAVTLREDDTLDLDRYRWKGKGDVYEKGGSGPP